MRQGNARSDPVPLWYGLRWCRRIGTEIRVSLEDGRVRLRTTPRCIRARWARAAGPVSGFTERAEAWEKVPSGSSSSTREWSGLAGLRVIP